jgi:flavin-dependent dehydrogenase
MYSSGVFLALKSGEMAADAINEALASNKPDAMNLSKWGDLLTDGMQTIRKLVYAFYTPGFSFGRFIRAYPDKVNDVTAILVGDVFRPEVKELFKPLSTMVPIPESTVLDKPKAIRSQSDAAASER